MGTEDDAHRVQAIMAGDLTIVETDSGYYPPKVADARLIAAAPELLAALTNLMRRLDDHFGGPERSGDWKEQEEARAAIAKAEGKEAPRG